MCVPGRIAQVVYHAAAAAIGRIIGHAMLAGRIIADIVQHNFNKTALTGAPDNAGFKDAGEHLGK